MKKRILSLLLALIMIFSTLPFGMISASADSTRKCYTIATGNTTVYTSKSLSTKYGTIYDDDEITVLDVHDDYTKVTYPVSGGTKTGYIKTSAILLATTGTKKTASAKITTYKRATSSKTYGSISKGDEVIVLGTKDGYTQVKYPVSSGYKYAFITTKNANKYLSSDTETASTSWAYPIKDAYVCGNNWHTYYSARSTRPYHVGLDLKSNSGSTAILAAAKGTVAKTGYNSANGNYVVIKHSLSGKTVYSFYAHLKSYCVEKGDSVSKGTKIGVIGNTGSASAGTHLHFAVVDTLWNGSYYGYVTEFSGNKVEYNGVTYYNPKYVIANGKLP